MAGGEADGRDGSDEGWRDGSAQGELEDVGYLSKGKGVVIWVEAGSPRPHFPRVSRTIFSQMASISFAISSSFALL